MRKTTAILLLLALSATFGQKKLFVPINFEEAVEKGTRTYDGVPGDNYWQNSSDYEIEVEVIPENYEIRGSEKVIYHNGSPDTLREIFVRLYHDFYKKGNSRDWQISTRAVNEGMLIDELSVNDRVIDPSDATYVSRNGTNMIIKLPEPLNPENNVEINIAWRFTIPNESKFRMGVYDSTSYYLAYWYPQISVYDDIDGWDRFDYGGTSEFYNDFNNYDVKITVPKNFLVWATGELQNVNEVLKKDFADKVYLAKKSDDIINIVTHTDILTKDVTAANEKNVWHFKAEYVPDFTFGTSDHYLWDGTSQEVGKEKKRVFIQAAYKIEAEDFQKVAYISREGIKYFSEELPGIPFPYPELTVFNGDGGMEAPMMVNDASETTWEATVGVTIHEIAHTYFPFYMGTNERKYAWMDEGMAVKLPFKIQKALAEKSNQQERNALGFENYAGREMEAPLSIPTINFVGRSYRVAAYARPGLAFEFLSDYLGEDKFKKALHLFMDRWKGKHPLPLDFFYTFNEGTAEDLSWFWLPWFFEQGYPDLQITKAEQSEKKLKVKIVKAGKIPVPIDLDIVFEDMSEKKIYKNAGVWKDKSEYIIELDIDEKVKSLKMESTIIPDSKRINNYYDF